MTDDVEVIISIAEYECPYEWDWTEVEYIIQTQDGPVTQRLHVYDYHDVYLIPREMFERWAAIREGWELIQKDIEELRKRARPVKKDKPASLKGLPF